MDTQLSRFDKGALVPGTPYEAVMLLGVGGMGSVYEVRHRVLGRRFVLKVLHGQLTSRRDLVARMANEWRTLGALNHKNIVSVTDAGFTSDGVPYYVMERLEGETLADLLRRVGRLEPRTAALFTLDILEGLSAAHGIGAIHRDIKPQNVFISGGMAKVLDFGVAKLRDKASHVITAVGLTIGTPRYMSPEQAAGQEVDARTDIYAVGLVFFEMLTGKSPFSHVKEPHELVLSQMSEEPPRVDWVLPGLPAELADVVHRWLSKSPRTRPHSAALAVKELKALVKTLPAASVDPTHITQGGQHEAETVGPGPGTSARPFVVHDSAVAGQAELGVAPTESALRPPEVVRPRVPSERALDQTDRALPAVTKGGRPAASRKGPWLLAGLGVLSLVIALGSAMWVRRSGEGGGLHPESLPNAPSSTTPSPVAPSSSAPHAGLIPAADRSPVGQPMAPPALESTDPPASETAAGAPEEPKRAPKTQTVSDRSERDVSGPADPGRIQRPAPAQAKPIESPVRTVPPSSVSSGSAATRQADPFAPAPSQPQKTAKSLPDSGL